MLRTCECHVVHCAMINYPYWDSLSIIYVPRLNGWKKKRKSPKKTECNWQLSKTVTTKLAYTTLILQPLSHCHHGVSWDSCLTAWLSCYQHSVKWEPVSRGGIPLDSHMTLYWYCMCVFHFVCIICQGIIVNIICRYMASRHVATSMFIITFYLTLMKTSFWRNTAIFYILYYWRSRYEHPMMRFRCQNVISPLDIYRSEFIHLTVFIMQVFIFMIVLWPCGRWRSDIRWCCC